MNKNIKLFRNIFREDFGSYAGNSDYKINTNYQINQAPQRSFINNVKNAATNAVKGAIGGFNGINMPTQTVDNIFTNGVYAINKYNNVDLRQNKYQDEILQIIKNSIENVGKIIKNEITTGKKFVNGIFVIIGNNTLLNPIEKADLFNHFISHLRLFCKGNGINFNDIISEDEIFAREEELKKSKPFYENI